MVSQMWVYRPVPLTLQWPVLKNGGADFHHCWFFDTTYIVNISAAITSPAAWLEHLRVS